MNKYWNVIVTIRATDQELAEQIVLRAVEETGYQVYDVAASRIKDDDIVKDLDDLGE